MEWEPHSPEDTPERDASPGGTGSGLSRSVLHVLIGAPMRAAITILNEHMFTPRIDSHKASERLS